MAGALPTPPRPPRGNPLLGLGLGALCGAVVFLALQRDALADGWREVRAQRWAESGLLRLPWLHLDEVLGALVLSVLGGAALGLLAARLLRRVGRVQGRLRWIAAPGLLLLLATLCLGAQRLRVHAVAAAGRPHVVWIVIDTLRADHLGCYGYEKDTSPFLDELAARGARFATCYSQESYTLASAASYFTSRPPTETGVLYSTPRFDALAPKHVTLAEVLRDAGYDTAGFVFNPHLWARYHFDQGFEVYDTSFPEIGDGHVTEESAAWEIKDTTRPMHRKVEAYLSDPAVARSGRPKLLYLHYFDVHAPFLPPPRHQQRFLPEDTPAAFRRWLDEYCNRPLSRYFELPDPPIPDAHKEGWPLNEPGLPYAISQYDGAIRHVDEALRRLFQLLAEHGIERRNTVVVVTSDHGESFLEPHPGIERYAGHGRTLHHEQLHVPLILSVPGAPPGQVVDEPVALLDVAPTLLDAAGLAGARPRTFRGRSLLDAAHGEPLEHRPVFAGGNHGRGVVLGSELLLYRHDGLCKARAHRHGERPEPGFAPELREEFYAAGDRRQQSALDVGQPGARRGRVRLLRKLLDGWLARAARAPRTEVELDAAALKALREAGYLGD